MARFRMSNTTSAKPCPRDGTPMTAGLGHGVLACGGCSGLWVPKAALAGRLDAVATRRLFHGGGGKLAGMRCPADGGLLWESNIGGVLIDRCNACGGLWFDAGELQRVLGAVDFTATPKPGGAASKRTPYLSDGSGGGIELAGEVVGAIIKFIATALVD
jgi:Zn-finger nucleic acid-binding protein